MVQWQPLPNWVGHLALAGLLGVVSPWSADRIMMSVTLLGFAAALVWLRWRVRGGPGIVGGKRAGRDSLPRTSPGSWASTASSWAAACSRSRSASGGPAATAPSHFAWRASAMLLILGYFGHLVSLGLTVAGLGFLALFAPAHDPQSDWWRSRLIRLGRTALPCLPLVVLGAVYLRLSRQGGPMRPVWENLSDPLSILAWISRLGWVDPLTLAEKDMLPFTTHHHRLFFVFSPVGWLGAAGLCLLAEAIGFRRMRKVARPDLIRSTSGTTSR